MEEDEQNKVRDEREVLFDTRISCFGEARVMSCEEGDLEKKTLRGRGHYEELDLAKKETLREGRSC